MTPHNENDEPIRLALPVPAREYAIYAIAFPAAVTFALVSLMGVL